MRTRLRLLLVPVVTSLVACASAPAPDNLSHIYDVNTELIQEVYHTRLPVEDRERLLSQLNLLQGYHALYKSGNVPKEVYGALVDKAVDSYLAAKQIIAANKEDFTPSLVDDLVVLDNQVQDAYRAYQQERTSLRTTEFVDSAVQVIGLLNRYGYLVL